MDTPLPPAVPRRERTRNIKTGRSHDTASCALPFNCPLTAERRKCTSVGQMIAAVENRPRPHVPPQDLLVVADTVATAMHHPADRIQPARWVRSQDVMSHVSV